MSRRAWAVVASLFAAPAGPLILGDTRRALGWFAIEMVGALLGVLGALYGLSSLFFGALALLVLLRLSLVGIAARLPPLPHPPSSGSALGLILLLVVVDSSVAYGFRHFVVEAFKIPAGSMIPTLQVGDHMFVDKRATHPKRGDVIVFRYPREPEKDFVKRVIAVGGDTIEVRDNIPVVNGAPLSRRPLDGNCSYSIFDESKAHWEERDCNAFEETLDGRSYRVIQNRASGFVPPTETKWTVPPGAFFVMGDNRDNSHDSRFWGTVPPDYVKGTAVWVWWSTGPNGVRSERMGQRIE